MAEKTWTVKGVDELSEVVSEVLAASIEAKSPESVVIALHGDLGAGKTTFTQELANKLGVIETVTSPTFVIMKRYETENIQFNELVHIDAYRIEDIDEMRVLGFEALLQEKDTIICIEWAEKITELLPKSTKHLTITIEGEKRIITLN